MYPLMAINFHVIPSKTISYVYGFHVSSFLLPKSHGSPWQLKNNIHYFNILGTSIFRGCEI
jgi:hypothetical protein